MTTPHEPGDVVEQRLERARRARAEWDAARAALEQLIEAGGLSGEELAEATALVGHHEQHRRRWGPPPS